MRGYGQLWQVMGNAEMTQHAAREGWPARGTQEEEKRGKQTARQDRSCRQRGHGPGRCATRGAGREAFVFQVAYHRNLLSRDSADRKSQIRCHQDHTPSESPGGTLRCFCPGFWKPLAFLIL